MSWSLQPSLPPSRCDALKYWLKWFLEFVYCLLSKYRSRSLSADPHHHPLEPILYTLPIACQSEDLEPGHIWQKPKPWPHCGRDIFCGSSQDFMRSLGTARLGRAHCHATTTLQSQTSPVYQHKVPLWPLERAPGSI